MQKRIFALGGGHYGQHKDTYTTEKPPGGADYFPWDTKPVDDLIVAAAGKQNPKVLALTTASEDGQHDVDLLYEAFQKRFGAYGCQTDILKLVEVEITPTEAEVEAAVSGADIVFVTGGNSYQMMEKWRQLGVDRLLRQAYERGAVMSGLSAGSICWFRWGNSNSFYTGKPFRVEAMGWLNAGTCPHYDSEPFRQEPFKQMLRQAPEMVGIALDEYAAIEIVDEKEFRIHIYRPGAKVRKCYWSMGEYRVEDVEEADEYSGLADLLKPAGLGE
ncbi:peptidase E [Candidatus Saccharibacteria bacterium]|nr:peptidase E [Candidatus Saccharibacteria bacterium]